METALVRFDHEWKHGDREKARELAREYCEAHRAELAPLEGYSLEDIVQLIDAYRGAGRETDRIAADMYLLTNYEPQHITGEFHMGGRPAVAAVEAMLKGE